MRHLTPFEHGLRDGRRRAGHNARVSMRTTEQVMDYWRGYQAGLDAAWPDRNPMGRVIESPDARRVRYLMEKAGA